MKLHHGVFEALGRVVRMFKTLWMHGLVVGVVSLHGAVAWAAEVSRRLQLRITLPKNPAIRLTSTY
jgi:hypothetical protein